MRDYAKLGPTFWTGETGKALRRRGSEALISALYLVSSPHSNMLGLYYQPLMYMAHETGLGVEGATKGLQDCIDVGFCSYDVDTEMVFVHEMAAWQIACELKANDLRCKGIQKDYEALPNCPFLGAFFERYKGAFNLSKPHAFTAEKPEVNTNPTKGLTKGDSKPLRSQEQEQEQEQEQAPSGPSEAKASAPASPSRHPLPPEAGEALAPMTAKDRVWAIGVGVFGSDQAARKRIGKLAGTYGDEVLAAVLAEAVLDPPVEPMSWVTAACEAKTADRPMTNGHGHGHGGGQVDMLADPHPAWALGAGFPNRFEAENAQCFAHNAAKFRDGKRVSQ